jgi:hypothetical protein
MDRRQAPRASYVRTVVLFSGTDRIVTTTVDTSVLGLSVRSGVRRNSGEVLRIAWPLGPGEWARAEAVVARTARWDAERCLLVGMRFLRVDPRLQREIALHVTRESARPPAPDAWVRGRTPPTPAASMRGRTPPAPSRSQSQLRLDPEWEAMLPRSRGELEALFRQAVASVDATTTGKGSGQRRKA